MNQVARAIMLAVVCGSVAGCAVGAPKRASDIQNTDGISDDIWAVSMTESSATRPPDPNAVPIKPGDSQTNVP